jgi:stage II sporulation protein GA (sporulation sigma-E factor processing peptidase)
MKGRGWMNVIYLDEVFLENTVIDYIILKLTADFSGVNVKRAMIILAAIVGGIYSVLAIFGGVWGIPVLKIVVGAVMVLIAFGSEAEIIRQLITFFTISAAFAGAVMAVEVFAEGFGVSVNFGEMTFKVLFFSFFAFYTVISSVLERTAKRKISGEITPVKISLGGKQVTVKALIDTGNSLHDPITGKNVMVCSLSSVENLFDRETVSILKRYHEPTDAMKNLGEKGEKVIFRLVPFHAVGVKNGMILAFRPDSMEQGGKKCDGLVAITVDGIKEGKGYSALSYAG